MGGELFGITGMFVAVPIAGMLRVVIETLRPPGLTEPPHLPEEQRAPASSEPEGQMIW
jgi:predicted PurR-regulated permease PerM